MDTAYPARRKKPARPSTFMERIFLEEKLNNPVGYALVLIIAGVFGYLISENTVVGLEVFAGIFGFFVLLACMLSTEAGFYIILVYSFFAYLLNRLLFKEQFPVGIASDVLIYATFLSLLIRRTAMKKNFMEFIKAPVIIVILLYIAYLLIEAVNPYAHSFDGWFQTFRRFLLCILLLFISYNIFTDYRATRRFLITLFVLCTFAGIYGCIQQWHGFFNFELSAIYSNKYGVVYINGGDLRKFSTMSDPMSYGTVMAATAIFYLIMAINHKDAKVRWALIFGSFMMIMGIAYSGTRTGNVMLVAGIGLYALLTFNQKSTRIFSGIAAFVFLFLLYVPIYNNGPLNRFRTSFQAKKDGSYLVREENRKRIQPYIYAHPIGGGLCTTGEPGKRFNPGHELAGFPPDSSYLRKALETGWIGLIFIFVVYFTTLQTAIRGYFTSRNNKRKLIYAACLAALFSFYVAEFAQEALGQITDMVIYYPFIALLVRLRYLDKKNDEAVA